MTQIAIASLDRVQLSVQIMALSSVSIVITPQIFNLCCNLLIKITGPCDLAFGVFQNV